MNIQTCRGKPEHASSKADKQKLNRGAAGGQDLVTRHRTNTKALVWADFCVVLGNYGVSYNDKHLNSCIKPADHCGVYI